MKANKTDSLMSSFWVLYNKSARKVLEFFKLKVINNEEPIKIGLHQCD